MGLFILYNYILPPKAFQKRHSKKHLKGENLGRIRAWFPRVKRRLSTLKEKIKMLVLGC